MLDNIFVTASERNVRHGRLMCAYLGSLQDLLLFDSSKYCHYAKITWGRHLELKEAWRSALQTVFAQVDKGLVSFDHGIATLKELSSRMLPEGMLVYDYGVRIVGRYFHDTCDMLNKHTYLQNPILYQDYLPQAKVENFSHNITQLWNFSKPPIPVTAKGIRRQMRERMWYICGHIVKPDAPFTLCMVRTGAVSIFYAFSSTTQDRAGFRRGSLLIPSVYLKRLFAEKVQGEMPLRIEGGEIIFPEQSLGLT